MGDNPFLEIAFDKTDETVVLKGTIGVWIWIGQPVFQHEGRVADFLWFEKWFADELETGWGLLNVVVACRRETIELTADEVVIRLKNNGMLR